MPPDLFSGLWKMKFSKSVKTRFPSQNNTFRVSYISSFGTVVDTLSTDDPTPLFTTIQQALLSYFHRDLPYKFNADLLAVSGLI